MPANTPAQSPKVAHLKSNGPASDCPVCRTCQHSGAVAFDAIGLPDETPILDLGPRQFGPGLHRARQCPSL
jgi:hypothetical protein